MLNPDRRCRRLRWGDEVFLTYEHDELVGIAVGRKAMLDYLQEETSGPRPI